MSSNSLAISCASLLRSYLDTPPRTDDELHHFIRAATGLRIPRKPVDFGHQAPFDLIADLYFQRVTHAIGFANRCGGKTTCMAVLDLCEQVLKPGVETIHFGAIQAQADAGYRYFREFLFANRVLRQLVAGEPTMNETRFKNGNRIRIAPLTLQQASSPHVPILAIDELDKVDRWDDFQQALSIPVSRGSIQASVRITSTRDTPHGCMNRLLEEAKERGFIVYEWNVWDMLQPCPDERICDGCPAWHCCEGSAKDLPTGGWMEIRDFINAASSLDKEKFQTQWFNELPGSDLLIYGRSWNDQRNLVEPHEIPADANRYLALDFGQRNPTAGVWAYDDSNQIVFYDEFQEENLPGAFLAKRIQEIERTRPWHWQNPHKKGQAAKVASRWVDPSGKAYIADLRVGGICVRNAANDLMGGISAVRAGLETGRIRFMKGRCPITVKHLKKYQWTTTPDGHPMQEVPLKVDDHLPDAVRYLVFSNHKWGRPGGGLHIKGI